MTNSKLQARPPESLGKRLLIGMGLLVVLGGCAASFGLGGIIIATFATDACSSFPDWAGTYIAAWPFVVGISILVPIGMIIARVRWLWAVVVAGVGFVVTVCWLVMWFPIVMSVC